MAIFGANILGMASFDLMALDIKGPIGLISETRRNLDRHGAFLGAGPVVNRHAVHDPFFSVSGVLSVYWGRFSPGFFGSRID